MTIEELQTHIDRNPRSPLFARLADEYLRAQRYDDALELCINGLQLFPDYATANLVIARCLVEKNDPATALSHLQVVLRTYPDNGVLKALYRAWEEQTAFAPPEQSIPQEPEAPAPEQISPQETVQSGETEVPPQVAETAKEEEDFSLDDVPIVSVTLAEIYATQGAYEAAIAMYRKLQRQKPQQAKEFEKKIEELRQKMKEGLQGT
jgi:tetratricopeptide (TPR) repeat protein